MFHKHTTTVLMLLLLACGACDDKASSTNNTNQSDAGSDAQSDMADRDAVLQVLPSSKSRVRFKGGVRWTNQLARGLGLDRAQICKEFGEYDCAADVHFIALGGVEPYNLRINEPLPIAPLTAPIAVDRIALSACTTRADLDAANPASAVLFKELASAPDSAAMRTMGNRLYQELLSRDAAADELDEIEAFWTEVQDAGAQAPAEWAAFSCYAVATSTEMLFY